MIRGGAVHHGIHDRAVFPVNARQNIRHIAIGSQLQKDNRVDFRDFPGVEPQDGGNVRFRGPNNQGNARGFGGKFINLFLKPLNVRKGAVAAGFTSKVTLSALPTVVINRI